MGGLNDGELVSAAAVGAMIREFPLTSSNWMPQQKLLYLAERANDAANLVTGGASNHGGSTLLSVLVRDGKLWFVSVGDSRICLVRGGSLITLTRPHAYETDLDRRAASGVISFEAALADGQRGALTSYIGMGELEALDYNPRGLQLLSGDWVILMTDGVFNALDEEEIASALFGEAQCAAERIESRVIAKCLPQQDNMTLVALRIL
jgi:serine/threonine protein phosphatase PrpC